MNPPTIQYPLTPAGNTDSTQPGSKIESQSDPESWAGKIIGEYLIEQQIGQGGNGRVYRATHRWLKLPVAIKVLQHVDPNDENSLGRFQREAQIAAKLRHQNLVRCTDGGLIGEKLFLVTDYVDGEDLRSLVRRSGPLPIAEACEIIRQTSLAMQFVVEHETIHRDIKPANIMLDSAGTVRVLDMGLARCTIDQHTLTETGQVMGTLDYIAPEQAVDSRHVDFRADIYSLGCTFYFLLTGRAPFSSDENSTLASKILDHLESDPPPIQDYRQGVPRPLIGLIDQMLHKSPESRPKSFQEVSKRVQAFSEKHNVIGLLTDTVETGSERRGNRNAERPSFIHKIKTGIASSLRALANAFCRPFAAKKQPTRARGSDRSNQGSAIGWLLMGIGFTAFSLAVWSLGGVIEIPDNLLTPSFGTQEEEPAARETVPVSSSAATKTPVSPAPTSYPIPRQTTYTPPPAPMHPPHHGRPLPPSSSNRMPPPHPPSNSRGMRFNQFQ